MDIVYYKQNDNYGRWYLLFCCNGDEFTIEVNDEKLSHDDAITRILQFIKSELDVREKPDV